MKLYRKPVGVLGTNCYIAADEQGVCAVFDPGAQPEKLVDFLKEHDLKPAYVLLTHGHFDHIGAVKAIARKFACPIAIGKGDEEMLREPEKSMATAHGFPGGEYVMDADELLSDGDVVTVGNLSFTVIDTPGHTKGGVTYRCEDVLFTGDTLFAGNIGRTDFYGGSYEALIASVKKLGAIEGDLRVLPGHGPDSTLAQEREENPYMRERSDDDFY